MSLEDLIQYVPAQTTAINQLVDTDRFSTSWPDSDHWAAFKESVWEKGLASLEVQEPVDRGYNPVEDSCILPGVIPATRSVMNIPDILFESLNLCNRDRRILVRSEYKEAEEAAVLATKDRMSPFVVTGQPGIGEFPPTLPRQQR